MALELLFWRGDLMITERRNFQKVYDLSERVLPSNLDMTEPAPGEVGRFLAHKALGALGVATEKEVLRFMQPATVRDTDWLAVDKALVSQALRELVEEGTAEAVRLEGPKRRVYYRLADSQGVEEMLPQDRLLHILSPFDNLIIQRERTKRLFDFDYVLECYVPAPKRRWGYFVLPLLWGDTFVGRLDAKANRQSRVLEVRSLALEQTDSPSDALLEALAGTLHRYARFNGCETVRLDGVLPKGVKKALTARLSSIISS